MELAPLALPHKSIQCRNDYNDYSGYKSNGVSNNYCSKCERKTHHMWKFGEFGREILVCTKKCKKLSTTL